MALRGALIEDNALFKSRTGIEEYYSLDDLIEEEEKMIDNSFTVQISDASIKLVEKCMILCIADVATTSRVVSALKTLGTIKNSSSIICATIYEKDCNTIVVIPSFFDCHEAAPYVEALSYFKNIKELQIVDNSLRINTLDPVVVLSTTGKVPTTLKSPDMLCDTLASAIMTQCVITNIVPCTTLYTCHHVNTGILLKQLFDCQDINNHTSSTMLYL